MTPDELHLAETLALLALPDDATPEDKAKALQAAREVVETLKKESAPPPDPRDLIRDAVAATVAALPRPEPDPGLSRLAESVAALAAREIPAPVVNVAPPVVTVTAPAPQPATKRQVIQRDASGEIVGIVTTEGE